MIYCLRNFKKSVLLVCILIACLAATGNAQTMPVNKDPLVMNADDDIIILQQKYVALNKLKQSIPGYRIQIHFGNEREKAREIKTKFLQEFPDIPAYDSYQSPNFRVRVGDYRSKLEAAGYLSQISAQFPSSFIVSDKIKYPKLIVD